MSQEKKYSAITEQDIANGLENGTFKKDGTLIRHKNGEIVKIIKDKFIENFPLIQVNTMINHTIIYQSDIQPFLDKLIEMKDIQLFDELSEIYKTIIKHLAHYKSYNDDLSTLNISSREALSKFENNINKYLNELENNKFENIDKTIDIINSYINILFIYLISTYKLHNKNISEDTIIKEQIEWLITKIVTFYRQLLVESYKDDKGVNQIQNIANSLYGYLLFEKRDKNDLGIYKIKKYIKYDNRFSSVTQFIAFIQKYIINEHIINDYNEFNYNLNDNRNKLDKQYFVNINIPDIDIIDKKQKLVDNLFNILEKITNLGNIYNELTELVDIDSDEIKSYLLPNNSFELLAI